MKRAKDYRPQYSLSIYYLKMCMSPKDLENLIRDYVKVKVEHWDERKGKKLDK